MEPTSARQRESVNLERDKRMETAAEPSAGVVNGDGFKGSQRWRMGLDPYPPEDVIVCTEVKESGQFANEMDDPVPKKEIAKNVKRDVTKMVGGVQARERETVNFSHRAPFPKEVDVRDADVRRALVPETKV